MTKTVTKEELCTMIEACLRPLYGLRVLVAKSPIHKEKDGFPGFGIVHGFGDILDNDGELSIAVAMESGTETDASIRVIGSWDGAEK